MKKYLFSLIAFVVFSPFSQADLLTTPVHQLRIYQIPRNNVQFFHERFRDQCLPIMKKYGFHVLATWQSEFEGKVEFVYLLEWPDTKTMEQSWDRFMADQEWKEIKKATAAAHGTYVEKVESRTLLLTDYSPSKSLQR
jgi:hypothetical protein